MLSILMMTFSIFVECVVLSVVYAEYLNARSRGLQKDQGPTLKDFFVRNSRIFTIS
jgi:hypothetical protein